MKTSILDLAAKALGFSTIKELLTDRYVTQKLSKEAIALELECDRHTISKLLESLAITRGKDAPTELTLHEAQNLTIGQIARKYDWSKSTSWRRRKKLLE